MVVRNQLASAQAQIAADRMEDAEALLGQGVALARGGRVAQALEPLRRAVALRPDWASAHYNLGVVSQRHGLAQAAADAYAKAIELDADHAGALLNLGTVLSEASMAEPAIAHFERVIGLAADWRRGCGHCGATACASPTRCARSARPPSTWPITAATTATSKWRSPGSTPAPVRR